MCSPFRPSRAALLPGPEGPGPVNAVLHVRFKSTLRTSELHFTVAGRRLVVFLQPRYVRVLVVLAKARLADRNEPPHWRGYRTSEEIGAAYADTLDGLGPLDDSSVVSYVSQIGQLVRRAVAQLGRELGRELEVPVFIESERLEGYRIAVHGFDVVGTTELEIS